MAEDTETLKNFITDLKKALECPICLDVVKHPFKLCARGHLMCVGCLKHLTACPTCQGHLLLDNPVCIQNVLEYLPHECRYSVNGCEKIVKNGNSHENLCGFRHIKCRVATCEQEVLAKELFYHFTVTHPGAVIITKAKTELNWSKFNPKEKRVGNNLVYLFDSFFWITVFNSDEEKQLKVFFEAIPVDKIEDDYYLKVCFINGEFNFTATMKACISEDNQSFTQEANVGIMNQNCMTVPQVMLSHFIQDGSLNVSELVFFKG